jgi:hypothetical protein
MTRTHRFTAFALAGVLGVSMLAAPLTARASEEGRRNTAIALGAAAVVGLLLATNHRHHDVCVVPGPVYPVPVYNRYDDVQVRYHRDSGRDDWRSGRDDHFRYQGGWDHGQRDRR